MSGPQAPGQPSALPAGRPPEPARPLVIVSGGQTGVDRAALAFARAHGIAVAGWCPRGGWAEDLPDPPGIRAHWPQLRETDSADPAERTRRNVEDAERLLVLWPPGAVSPGTALAIAHARALGRPVAEVRLQAPDAIARIAAALAEGGRLCIAGPRESEWPRGGEVACRMLRAAWARLSAAPG